MEIYFYGDEIFKKICKIHIGAHFFKVTKKVRKEVEKS